VLAAPAVLAAGAVLDLRASWLGLPLPRRTDIRGYDPPHRFLARQGARPGGRVARAATALAHVHPGVRPALSLRRRPGARSVGALGASPPFPRRGRRRHLDGGPGDLPAAARPARAGAA